MHWNIVFIESNMYKSVLRKVNKLQKKKYIVQKCSRSLCATSRRIRIQRDSAMVMKMIEFVHDHGPRWITSTVRELLILSLIVSRNLRFPSGLHCILFLPEVKLVSVPEYNFLNPVKRRQSYRRSLYYPKNSWT